MDKVKIINYVAKYCDLKSVEPHKDCIYCYVNIINGKKYIGQAVNFKTRHSKHLNLSPNFKYPQIIDLAIKKYGYQNFEVYILKENLSSLCLKNLWESYYIDFYETLSKFGKGYNIASGGSKGNSYAGKTEEEMMEIKDKISRAHRGRKHSPEIRKRMSEGAKKKPPMSDETKEKISKATSGKNNPFYGKKHTKETIEKLRIINSAKTGEKNSNYGNRGSKNPISVKIVGVHVESGEVRHFGAIKEAAEILSKELGVKVHQQLGRKPPPLGVGRNAELFLFCKG